MRDQLSGVNQQARRHTFFQTVTTQVADLLSDQNQIARGAFIDAAFARDDLGLDFRRRIVKIDRDEASGASTASDPSESIGSRDCRKRPA